jgi:RNA polymerase sigma-32 factor
MGMEVDVVMRNAAMEAPLLDRETEVSLARAWRDRNCVKSRDRLVCAHQKLVMGMARKFERLGVSFIDLYNEGVVALLVACDKYDPDTGNRFATYAQWWVLTHMQEYVQRETSPVRVGKTRKEKAVFRAIQRARRKHGPALSPEHRERIAQAFGVTPDEVQSIEAATGLRALSLNQAMGDDENGAEFIENLVDETQTPERMLALPMDAAQRRVVEGALSELDERERTVIRERFLMGGQRTLRELAQRLDISAERVRQVEREALARLRRILDQRGLCAEDLLLEIGRR